MAIAIWIIAICSIVRIIQNGIQLSMLIGEKQMRKNLHNEFIDSLKKDNKEWAEDLLKAFVNKENEDDVKRYLKQIVREDGVKHGCHDCRHDEWGADYWDTDYCSGCVSGEDKPSKWEGRE